MDFTVLCFFRQAVAESDCQSHSARSSVWNCEISTERVFFCFFFCFVLKFHILGWLLQFFDTYFMRKEKNQLDATEWFIAPIICSTFFEHFYAYHQEIETVCMLLPL